VLGLLLAFTGCSDGTIPVTGTVTIGGQTLMGGSISLTPDAETGLSGPGANAQIRDGRFEVVGQWKVKPGQYDVRISPPPYASIELRSPDGKMPAGLQVFKHYTTKLEVKAGTPIAIDIPASHLIKTY